VPITKGDVQIYYETRGSRDGIPLLLVQGFTWQLIGWREGFCQTFVDRGAFVILYDNRDVGLSQKFGGPEDYDGGYSLTDMARDGFAVLDNLGLQSAHLVGASMGGMIAQIMALSQPPRVRSLNLIYTAPSMDPRYFVQQDAQAAVPSGKRLKREEALEEFVARERASASTAYPYDEQWVRELGSRMYERCYAPDGILRQLCAMLRWAPIPDALGSLDMPSSIIHGRADGRIRAEAALDIGRVLKNSEMHIYPGLGHEIPAPLWNEFATIIMRTAARA
jgi:pimeloyl-ACP methyl ester carboxylesterase